MCRTLSAKYYQENKERLPKKARERYQNFSEEEKEKSADLVVNVAKVSQEMKSKRLLSIEQKRNEKKCFIIIIKKYFNLENFAFL